MVLGAVGEGESVAMEIFAVKLFKPNTSISFGPVEYFTE